MEHIPEIETRLTLSGELQMFEYVVPAEFKDRFRTYRMVSDDSSHIIVPMGEYLELTPDAADLGNIVRTGTKVRITKCPPHPEYVNRVGHIVNWIAPTVNEDNVMYAIRSNGEMLEGLALREHFEIVEP